MNPDQAYGYQCVDVADDYCIALWGNYSNTIGSGNASALYGAASTTYFTKIANNTNDPNLIPVHGDIVVWGGTPGWPNYGAGHIAVVDSADVNGMYVFEQNYSNDGIDANDPCARRSEKYYNSVAGTVIGWLRPKLDSGPRWNPIVPGDGGFTKGGTAAGWNSFAGGVFGTALYTNPNGNTRDDWARWTFDLSKLNGAGSYKVEAYVTSLNAGTLSAHYHISTSSGVAYATVNQSSLSNQYANLGTYALSSGSAWIELDDATGEPYGIFNRPIVFDAIRLTYVGPPPDTTKPIVTTDIRAKYSGSATINITATDTGSGVASVTYVLDSGPPVTVVGATARVQTSVFCGHTLTCYATDVAGNVSPTVANGFTVSGVTRLDGSDRFAVAAGLARKGWDPGGAKTWPNVSHVVIANGESGKEGDPLSAAGLAGVYTAPVLLTSSASLPNATRSVIKEIAAKRKAEGKSLKVHVIGGTGSVPESRWSEIRRIPGVNLVVDRISGSDRYEVSAAIANRMAAINGAASIPGVIIIAADNPNAYFDALAVSPVAYSKRMPMLSVRRDSVPTAIGAVMAGSLEGKPRFAASGSSYIAGSLSGATRLATSSNRYTAAAQIASQAISRDWLSAADSGLSAKVPDALTGGTFLGKRGGVMLFTDSSSKMQTASSDFINARKVGITNGWIFGGTGSVPATQQSSFANLLK